MTTAAEAYGPLLRDIAQHLRSPMAPLSARHRSHSDESFVDLEIENLSISTDTGRRRSSFDLSSLKETTRPTGPTSEGLKTRIKGIWHNMKYGWTVISPGTQIDEADLNESEPLYLLGQMYHTRSDPQSYANFMDDFRTRMWFTYRQDFDPICETNHQSDSGWGCMIRSAQMLLAQAFMLHLLGRDWRWYSRLERPQYGRVEEHGVHRMIISWFGDGADPKKAPFGIHNLVRAARQFGNKRAGDWFGPSSVAYMLKRCMEDAAATASSKEIFEQMTVYVTLDCTIYTQDVIDLCESNPNIPWKSVVILVPLRLGGETINSNYLHSIKDILADSRLSCVGIIGGKPKHSLYFIGVQGKKLVFLDPHYLQRAIRTADHFPVESYHCTLARKISFSKLDPSSAIGFYCKTRRDFDNLSALIKSKTDETNQATGSSNLSIITVREGRTPVCYESGQRPESGEDCTVKVERNVMKGRSVLRREADEYVLVSETETNQ